MNAATETPDGDLPAARRALHNAIHQLTEPIPHIINREDGTQPLTWLDSLYLQLQEAVAGQTGPRSGGRPTVPLWTDALDLLNEIDTAIQAAHPQEPTFDGDLTPENPPTPVTVRRLHALDAKRWRPQDVHRISQLTAALETWATQIETTLDGQHVRFLYAAESKHLAKCPACDTDMVRRRDSSGEFVRQPALQLHPDGSTHCVACRYTWGPERMQILAAALGYPLPKGVLE